MAYISGISVAFSPLISCQFGTKNLTNRRTTATISSINNKKPIKKTTGKKNKNKIKTKLKENR